jgi:hypothetical protein
MMGSARAIVKVHANMVLKTHEYLRDGIYSLLRYNHTTAVCSLLLTAILQHQEGSEGPAARPSALRT